MDRKFVKILLIAAVMGGGWGGCSRSHRNNNGSEDDALNPDRWRPTADALAAAKREKKASPIVVRTTQPRASAYDLNPRAGTPDYPNQETNPGSASTEQTAEDDPGVGDIERLPPPPMPKLASGDEADQFGLPEWEQIARGELHVKRIQY